MEVHKFQEMENQTPKQWTPAKEGRYFFQPAQSQHENRYFISTAPIGNTTEAPQVNTNIQPMNNEFIPSEPTPANEKPTWWKPAAASSGAASRNGASFYLPSQNAAVPEMRQFSTTAFRSGSVPLGDATESNWRVQNPVQQNSQGHPLGHAYSGQRNFVQNPINRVVQSPQSQYQQILQNQGSQFQVKQNSSEILNYQSPNQQFQGQASNHAFSAQPASTPTSPPVERKQLVRRRSSGGSVKTKADHWVQQNSATAQTVAKGAPWPVKTTRTKVLAAARQDGQVVDSETMKPIHVLTSPQQELPAQTQNEMEAVLQQPVYSQHGLLTVAQRSPVGAVASLANGSPMVAAPQGTSQRPVSRPQQLPLDVRQDVQHNFGQPAALLPVQQPMQRNQQPSMALQQRIQQHPNSVPIQQYQPSHPNQWSGQQQVPCWTLLKSMQPPPQIQPPSPNAPWSQKQWKSVLSPSSEHPPSLPSVETVQQQQQLIQNVPANIVNRHDDTFTAPPTSPKQGQQPLPGQKVAQNFGQANQTTPTQPAPSQQAPFQKRKSIPGPGGPIFTNWVSTKPPTPPSTPAHPPQEGFNFQPHPKAAPQAEEAPEPTKAPPPVLPKPKLASPTQPTAAQPRVEKSQSEQQAQPTQPGWPRGKLSEASWPPLKTAQAAPPATPKDFTVNDEPESKNWTLEKPQQKQIKSALEHVIRAPGSEGPNPKIKHPMDGDSNSNWNDSTNKSTSAQPANDNAADGQEHLLKPSAIKAQQPKLSPEQLKAMDITIPKMIQNISKVELLNQYTAAWNDAATVGDTEVVRCGLPEHKRPTDAENDTDVEKCIKRLRENDPTLTEINLNNMKRTPIPQLQRLLATLKENTQLKKLSLANLGLSDNAMEIMLEAIESNKTLELLNIETNFLTGNFLVRLFQSALVQQTLREVKAVNQTVTFSNVHEQEMMKAIYKNRALLKVSLNLRLTETRSKVEKALIRNGELRRLQRKLEAEGWDFQEYIQRLSNQEEQEQMAQ